MNTTATFETGATTHAVNDLILFTDNTKRLAELRDEIYSFFVRDDQPNFFPKPEVFKPLYKKARQVYFWELKQWLSITPKEEREYCTLYANDFDNWKKEHTL